MFNLYAAGDSAEKLASDKQMAVLLDQLIATLPGKLREPMLLSLNQELTNAEISRILSIPASVRTRLFRSPDPPAEAHFNPWMERCEKITETNWTKSLLKSC